MSTDVEPGIGPAEDVEPQAPSVDEEEAGPREWESALLSIVLFAGLIVFAVSCTMFGW
mgnify:CR=1 FL=1